jgi:hypothetical protein
MARPLYHTSRHIDQLVFDAERYYSAFMDTARICLSEHEVEELIPDKLKPIWRSISEFYPSVNRHAQKLSISRCSYHCIDLKIVNAKSRHYLPEVIVSLSEVSGALRDKLNKCTEDMYATSKLCASIPAAIHRLGKLCTTWTQFGWVFPAALPLFSLRDDYRNARKLMESVSRPPRIMPAIDADTRLLLKTATDAMAAISLLPRDTSNPLPLYADYDGDFVVKLGVVPSFSFGELVYTGPT